ncbi:hypothetical protein ACLKA6_001624 [Drosophila palustris]
MYSLGYRRQNCRDETARHRLKQVRPCCPAGIAVNGPHTSAWPGVSASPSLGSSLSALIGHKMSLKTSTRKRKIAAAIILHCCLEEEEEQELKLRTRTTWVQELYLEREESGFFRSFQSIFRSNSADRFKDFARINPDDFDFILERVRPLIEKADTKLRRAISAAERLAVTLRYLATGDSMQSLSFLFKISVPSISMMVHEGCDAIYKTLKDDFLKFTG